MTIRYFELLGAFFAGLLLFLVSVFLWSISFWFILLTIFSLFVWCTIVGAAYIELVRYVGSSE